LPRWGPPGALEGGRAGGQRGDARPGWNEVAARRPRAVQIDLELPLRSPARLPRFTLVSRKSPFRAFARPHPA
jgi:hypothetical protein